MTGKHSFYTMVAIALCYYFEPTFAFCTSSSLRLPQRPAYPSTTIQQRIHLSPVARLNSSADRDGHGAKNVEKKVQVRAFGTLQVSTLIGGVLAAFLSHRVLTTTTSRLFQQHVIGASLAALVFFPAAIKAAKSRIRATQQSTLPAKDRRGLLIRHITAHLYLTYAAALCTAISVVSIFLNKIKLGKPHFNSLHSRLALSTVALYAAAYVVAQIKVWKPMIQKKNWKVGPTLLWASQRHKRFGRAASLMATLTVATGICWSPWGRTAFSSGLQGLLLIALFVAYRS